MFGEQFFSGGHSKKGECSSNNVCPPHAKEQFFATFGGISTFDGVAFWRLNFSVKYLRVPIWFPDSALCRNEYEYCNNDALVPHGWLELGAVLKTV